MLYINFIQELEKIARSSVGSTLDIKADPYGLGMHSRREGKDTGGLGYRPLAYPQGVATAAIGGAGAGALLGPFTEGRLMNVLTQKGRKKISEGFKTDVSKALKDVDLPMKGKAALGGHLYAGDLVRRKLSGGKLSDAEAKTLRNVGDVAKRRAALIPKAMGRAAMLAGGIKLMKNIGEFEQARMLTPELAPTKKPKKVKSI